MTEANIQTEQTFVENEFGTVTSKRVIYFRNKGWMSGGSREDIPLQHVTSVRMETSRSIVGAILLLLIGLGSLAGPTGVKIFGLVCLAFGILLIWGSPKIVVNTAGGDLNAAKGLPWKREAANSFVEALRKQLFAKSAA